MTALLLALLLRGGPSWVAALLLAQPAGVPVPLQPEGVLRGAREVALREEWLDPREALYTFRPAPVERLQLDWDQVRARRQELEHAPPVGEARRFPPLEGLRQGMHFNRAYRKHLEQRSQLELDREEVLIAAIREVDRRYAIWDAASGAVGEFYFVATRRRHLSQLREQLGEEDYLRAQLPPCVPYELFDERR